MSLILKENERKEKDMNRREFLKSGSAAVAAAGVAGCVTSDITASVEKTIAETKFIDIHAHCTIDPMPPIDASGLKPLACAMLELQIGE